jgi:urease accessory protein
MTALAERQEQAVAGRSWSARLDLELAMRDGVTRLVGRRQRGPLAVQRPLYPEGPVCHLYLLHPPGGVVGGDSLDIRLTARNAAALLTTPGATKFYRGNGFRARQQQRLEIGVGSAVEWLPQENIFFDGAVCDLSTTIRRGPGAAFIAQEIHCFGRPACGERFAHGEVRSRLAVYDGDALVLDERLVLDPGQGRGHGAAGLRGHQVIGTLLLGPADDVLLDMVRGVDVVGVVHGATRLDDLLVVRALADDAAAVRELFASAWGVVRMALFDRPPHTPRIWLT